jgi:hypothetical protein
MSRLVKSLSLLHHFPLMDLIQLSHLENERREAWKREAVMVRWKKEAMMLRWKKEARMVRWKKQAKGMQPEKESHGRMR